MEIRMNKFQKVAMYAKQKSYQLAVGAGVLVAAGSAQAAIDVGPIVLILTDGIAAAVAIGVIVLSVWATKKVYSMIKGG
jgi:hypothetical protein